MTPFERLKRVQTELNVFAWSADLGLRATVADLAEQDADRLEQSVSSAFQGVDAVALASDSKRRIRYGPSLRAFRQDLDRYRPQLFRAVIIFFHTAFDAYLDDRLPPPRKSWGPSATQLVAQLRKTRSGADRSTMGVSVDLSTVLVADLCRLVRNTLVHKPEALPTTVDEALAVYAGTLSQWTQPNHAEELIRERIGWVCEMTMNQRLPIEYFYLLGTFSGLHNLAREIEAQL